MNLVQQRTNFFFNSTKHTVFPFNTVFHNIQIVKITCFGELFRLDDFLSKALLLHFFLVQEMVKNYLIHFWEYR